jgi:quercetin dioxygenase-like cupin family protein
MTAKPCTTDTASLTDDLTDKVTGVPRGAALYRWDEIALEKVTEMLSRKVVHGDRGTLVQVYVKRGCVVPMHAHDSEQTTYVLQGALRFLVGGEDVTVREGEVLMIPPGVPHQAEALDDTFELDIFSPVRAEWLVSASPGSDRTDEPTGDELKLS